METKFQYYSYQNSCIIADDAELFMNRINGLETYDKVKSYILEKFPNIESEKSVNIEYPDIKKKIHCEYNNEGQLIFLMYCNDTIHYGYAFRPQEEE